MAELDTTLRRVSRASASGVLGEYDHEIGFKGSGELSIIYGPNGVGKTKFLEILEALSNLRVDLLCTLPFASAQIQFTDGSAFEVAHETADVDFEEMLFFEVVRRDDSRRKRAASRRKSEFDPIPVLRFSIYKPDGGRIDAPLIPIELAIDREQSSLGSRRDMYPGALRERLQRVLGHDLSPTEARTYLRHMDRGPEIWRDSLPEDFHDFAKSVDVRMIATQRLMTQDLDSRIVNGRRESGSTRPTIEQYSQTIRDQLANNLSENSRLAQRLDSSFPRRMLEAGESSNLTEVKIRARLKDQSHKRARIEQITPLGLGPELPLPPGELSPGQKAVLELYLEDAEQKLKTFASTVEKIDLLERIVNDRLLGKQLRVSVDDGIVITRNSNGDKIPLVALSSGEQHEIILMFDLLFNVRPGGLVLIDEPEISLHIAWQQQFIADVLSVARVATFQFVIATHSPQIIDNYWPFAKRLGPSTEKFSDADHRSQKDA